MRNKYKENYLPGQKQKLMLAGREEGVSHASCDVYMVWGLARLWHMITGGNNILPVAPTMAILTMVFDSDPRYHVPENFLVVSGQESRRFSNNLCGPDRMQ
jgi:hypothetical protein